MVHGVKLFSKFACSLLIFRKTMICKQYASELGLEEFLHPINYVEMYWQKEDEQKFGRGSCMWNLPPGILTKNRKYGHFRFP